MINSVNDNYSKNTREKSILLRNKLVPVQLLKPYYKFFVGDKYKELKNQVKVNMSYFGEDNEVGEERGFGFLGTEKVIFFFGVGVLFLV